MVVQGETIKRLQVTVEEIAYHTRAVARGSQRASSWPTGRRLPPGKSTAGRSESARPKLPAASNGKAGRTATRWRQTIAFMVERG